MIHDIYISFMIVWKYICLFLPYTNYKNKATIYLLVLYMFIMPGLRHPHIISCVRNINLKNVSHIEAKLLNYLD